MLVVIAQFIVALGANRTIRLRVPRFKSSCAAHTAFVKVAPAYGPQQKRYSNKLNNGTKDTVYKVLVVHN